MTEEEEVAAWFAGRADQVIETSCARVFLTGEAAFKVKKRVDFGFLDFRSLADRERVIARELAFNRATAPDIYRAVHRVTKTKDGFELDGEGALVDVALEMRRFDPQAVLSDDPERVDGALAERLGRLVAQVHAAAPVRPEAGGVAALGYVIGSNAEVLSGLGHALDPAKVEALIAATEGEFARQSSLLEQRRAEGFGRRCHGDLHLGNILLEDGRPILFDCIEFNDRLSDIDVQYDLAFLIMDLAFRGQTEAACRVMAAYIDEAARTEPAGLIEGLAALPLMLSVRAAVRAHVLAHSDFAPAARAYVDAALGHLSPRPPSLVAVGGLSGTGKSTLARALAPRFGAWPGALVLRTDEVRKRLMGVAPETRLPPERYAPAVSEAVYDTLFRDAAAALAAGRAVILDATFLQPAMRARAEALAQTAGAPFQGVWLDADPAVLRARVAGRVSDASDADLATLEAQLGLDLGEIGWRRLEAGGALDEAVLASIPPSRA